VHELQQMKVQKSKLNLCSNFQS